MRSVNIPHLTSMWAALKMKYPDQIDLSTLKEECKKLRIPLADRNLSGYIKVGVLQRLRKGIYIIDATPRRVVNACDYVRDSRKKYHEQHTKREIFNATIEPAKKLTPEMAMKYLKDKGYFIYLPKKGEKITITLTF